MAIKFQCNCGHVLSVPDNLAGKSGKCPKCKQSIQVPQASSVAASAAVQPVARPASQPSARPAAKPSSRPVKGDAGKPAAAATRGSGLDSHFDDLGLKRQTGPVCPSCSAPYKTGAAVCIQCGLNFSTGEKAVGFAATREKPEFSNLYLQEAANNMRREKTMERRSENASMPWWVVMSYLIGAITLCAAGIIIVDGIVAEPAPEGSLMGKLQRMPVLVTLGATAGITGLAIMLFAHLSICAFAFSRKALHGVGCLFLPLLFSVPYGIANWTDNKAPVKAIISSLLFLGGGAGLIVWGGGFGHLSNLF
jgi:hypothetical protein